MLVPMAQFRFVLVGMSLCALGPGCTSSPQQSETVWPPADFRLEVEWTSGGAPSTTQTKRFVVRADGLCVYGKSASPLVDPVSKTALPVFDTMCAYRVRSECVRLLARKLEQRGVTKLELQQGTMEAADAPAVRIVHRAFGKEHAVTAVGQVHGAMVRVLHIVNAHLPTSESFFLPGMTGDPEPENLAAVPAPVAGAAGALAWHEEQLREGGDQPLLLLDAFALACRAQDRARSEDLLTRWETATRVAASKDAPFVDAPRLLPEMLRRMLP
jgi:hypothetical protein